MAAKVFSRILIVAAVVALIVAAAMTFRALNSAPGHQGMAMPEASPAPKPPQKVMYHCPMHPNVASDHPGKCPICGMDLVPMTADEMAAAAPTPVEGRAPITLTAERRQLIGLQICAVEKRSVTRTIRAAARVEYDEKTLATVNLKFGGWITQLMVKSVGETVRKGQPLMAIYSPDLLEAQRNYLAARAALASLDKDASADSRSLAEETLRSARERLRLWDFSDEQIQSIESSQQPLHDVTIFSKADGVVTARNATLGGSVEPGRNLLEIADLTTVWLTADVFESEAPLVKTGQAASVALVSSPGEPLTGVVNYIYPFLNPSTRTLSVRVECPNPDARLKPGMYAAVSIAVDLGEQLVVDDDAVLDTGLRQIVFVDKGEGRLEPREVTLSGRADGLAIIAKGLAEGEKIVTSGNFLVDSESRMKAGLGQIGGPSMPEPQPAPKAGMPNMPGM